MQERSINLIKKLDLEARFEAVKEQTLANMDRHMITRSKGHTRAVSGLDRCHEGREAASFYAAGTLLGRLEEEVGLEMLKEIAKLQVRDPEHPRQGGFRWYREETEIEDTNAAFFTMMPLVSAAHLRSDNLPAAHCEAIREMCRWAVQWFRHECAHPKLFYPNKIVSDGALLLAASALIGDEAALADANAFFARWLDYTARRGWGWGENTSTSYAKVILDAFQLALTIWNSAPPPEPELERGIRRRREELLEWFRFHAGKEFVPSIRSYNFDGQTLKPSAVNLFAGVRFWTREAGEDVIASVHNLFLYDDLLPAADGLEPSDSPEDLSPDTVALPVPRSRSERIFDDAYAYTWIGLHCRLGSVSRFPAMPGSYQWPDWGLGWQSMPVSFLVEGEQVSFLRFAVQSNQEWRTHLASGFHGAYLSPALFREQELPDMETTCAQKDNVLIVQRTIRHLANAASAIADEWCVQRFQGKVHRLRSEGSAVLTSTATVTHAIPEPKEIPLPDWTVLEFGHCRAAILALSYWDCEADQAKVAEPAVTTKDGTLLLTRRLYQGEERLLRRHRLDNAWVVILIDRPISLEALQEHLLQFRVFDRRLPDDEVPRSDPFMVREIVVEGPDGFHLAHRDDPYAR